ITHPQNPLLLKREGDFQNFFSPSLPKRRGQGDEFGPKNITELESQNSLGIFFISSTLLVRKRILPE
ncbi:MAG: hypothetical protein ACRENG_14725, partial [bacterium]